MGSGRGEPGDSEDLPTDYRKFPAGDHWLFVRVARGRRPFRVHVPKELDQHLLPVIAFDGVTLFNQAGSMGYINGLDDASERHRFIAIYPIPRTRYFGILAGWNTRGGYLSYRPELDDVDYIWGIIRRLQIKRMYVVGFSAGAQFAHILAGRLPGFIAGVVSVSGTWLGTEASPPAGTAALIFHGENDPVFPYKGGGTSWRTEILRFLGNRNVSRSRPYLQIRAYAAANGYPGVCFVEEPRQEYVKRTFGPGEGASVVEYFVLRPHGGHTYHGRKIGEGTESVLSEDHGRPLPPEVLSINDLLGELVQSDGRVGTRLPRSSI